MPFYNGSILGSHPVALARLFPLRDGKVLERGLDAAEFQDVGRSQIVESLTRPKKMSFTPRAGGAAGGDVNQDKSVPGA